MFNDVLAVANNVFTQGIDAWGKLQVARIDAQTKATTTQAAVITQLPPQQDNTKYYLLSAAAFLAAFLIFKKAM